MSLYERVLGEAKKPKDRADIDKIVAYFKAMREKGMMFFSPGSSLNDIFSRFPHEMTAGRRVSLLKKYAAEIGEAAGMKGLQLSAASYSPSGAGAFGHLGGGGRKGKRFPASLMWKW